jgi:hypothetical protein
MKNFTIENETNNIAVHGSVKEAEAVPNSERFGNEAALAKLAANWPASRLIEIWNSLPGETPVRKFKDRATAVSRIWKAIQSLGQTAAVAAESELPEEAPVLEAAADRPSAYLAEVTMEAAEQPATETVQQNEVIAETTEHAPATTVAPHTPDVAPPEAPARKKATRAKTAPTGESAGPREGSKTSQVIAMLKREGGTTLEEIMAAMAWQKHTTRAMLSAGGSLAKKHGLTVTSEKVGDKRVYSIKP